MNPDGTFTPAEHRLVAEWLATKWTQPQVCPCCGTSSWTYQPQVVDLRVIAVPTGRPPLLIPTVLVSCNECGFYRLFSAIRMGLLEKGEAVPLFGPRTETGDGTQ